MSEQILLQGKILGIEEFLRSPSGAGEDAPDVLAGRAQWISLLSEVLPRALLAELGLARILPGSAAADPACLARRAQGLPVWGVLRGDVDGFGVRLRRLTTIEEHVQVSVLYKQFFAGELEVLCPASPHAGGWITQSAVRAKNLRFPSVLGPQATAWAVSPGIGSGWFVC